MRNFFPSFLIGLVMMRLLCLHSVAACDYGMYKNGNSTCCRCKDGWFVLKHCLVTPGKNDGTKCMPCKDCEKSGLETVSRCTNVSDAVCKTEPTTTPTTTPVPIMDLSIQPGGVVIALCITTSVVVLLIIVATAYKLYLIHKAPVDPAMKPLKTPSITESIA